MNCAALLAQHTYVSAYVQRGSLNCVDLTCCRDLLPLILTAPCIPSHSRAAMSSAGAGCGLQTRRRGAPAAVRFGLRGGTAAAAASVRGVKAARARSLAAANASSSAAKCIGCSDGSMRTHPANEATLLCCANIPTYLPSPSRFVCDASCANMIPSFHVREPNQ